MSYNRKELQVQSSAKKKQNPFLKDMIYDPRGQWAYPGQPTRIPSNQITMARVPYPVLGIDNFGNQQMMYPGGEYSFPGDYVDEFPMAQVSASVPDYAAQAFFSDTQKRRQREEALKSLGPTAAKAKALDELRREEAKLKSKRREESSVLNNRSIANDPAEVILSPFLENLSAGINTDAGYDKKWSSFAKRAFGLNNIKDYTTEVDEFGRPTPGAIEQSLFNMYLTRKPNNIFEPYPGDPTAVQIKDYERYLPDTLTIPKEAMPIIQDALYTGINNEMSQKLQEQFPDVPEHVIENWIGQLHGLRDYGFGRNYTTVDTVGDNIYVERKDDFGFWQDNVNSNEPLLQKSLINALESTVKSTGAGPFNYRQKWQYKIDPKTKYGILQRQYGGQLPKAQISDNIPASEYKRIYGVAKDYATGQKTINQGDDMYINPKTGYGYFDFNHPQSKQEQEVPESPWNLSRFVFDPIVRGKGQTVDANIYDPTTGEIVGRQPFRDNIDSYSQRKIMRKGMPLAKEDLYKYYTQDLNLSKKEARPLVREKMGQLRDMKRFKNIVGPKSQESFKSSNVKSLFDEYRKSSTEQKYSPLDYSRIFAKTGERVPTLSDRKMQKGYSRYLQIWDDKSRKEAKQISKDLLNKSKLEDQQQLDEWANMFGISTKDFIKNNEFYRRGKEEKYSDWVERTGLKMQYGGNIPEAQVSGDVEYPEIYRKRFLGKGESYITKTPFGKHVEKWKYNPLTKTYVAKEIDIAYKDENSPRTVYRKKEIANKNNAYAIHKKRTGMNPWEKWIEEFQVSGSVNEWQKGFSLNPQNEELNYNIMDEIIQRSYGDKKTLAKEIQTNQKRRKKAAQVLNDQSVPSYLDPSSPDYDPEIQKLDPSIVYADKKSKKRQAELWQKLKTLFAEYKATEKNLIGSPTYTNFIDKFSKGDTIENLEKRTGRVKEAIKNNKINYKKGKIYLAKLRDINKEKYKNTKVIDLYRDPEILDELRNAYKTGNLEENRFKEYYEAFGKNVDVNVIKGSGPNAAYDAEKAEQIFNPGGISTAEVAKDFTIDALTFATGPLWAAAAPAAIPFAHAVGRGAWKGLTNPYVQLGLTGYGIHDAVTKSIPNAVRDFSKGDILGGIENAGWAALDLAPGAIYDDFAGAFKTIGKDFNIINKFNKTSNVPSVKPALDEIEELRRIAQSPEKTISKYDPTNWGSWKERPIEKFEVEATLRNNRNQLKDYFPDDDFPLTENLPLSQVDRTYMTDHEIGTLKNLIENLKQHEPGTPMHDAISYAIKNYKKNIFEYKTSGKPLTGSDAFRNINVNSLMPLIGTAGLTSLGAYNQYQDEGQFPQEAGLGLLGSLALGLPMLRNMRKGKGVNQEKVFKPLTFDERMERMDLNMGGNREVLFDPTTDEGKRLMDFYKRKGANIDNPTVKQINRASDDTIIKEERIGKFKEQQQKEFDLGKEFASNWILDVDAQKKFLKDHDKLAEKITQAKMNLNRTDWSYHHGKLTNEWFSKNPGVWDDPDGFKKFNEFLEESAERMNLTKEYKEYRKLEKELFDLEDLKKNLKSKSVDPEFKRKVKEIYLKTMQGDPKNIESFVENMHSGNLEVIYGDKNILVDPDIADEVFRSLPKDVQEHINKNLGTAGGYAFYGGDTVTFKTEGPGQFEGAYGRITLPEPTLKPKEVTKEKDFSLLKPKTWTKKGRTYTDIEFKPEIDYTKAVVEALLNKRHVHPLTVGEVAAHETAHPSQRLFGDWIDELQKNNPDYGYVTGHEKNELAKAYKEAMVEPTKVPEGSDLEHTYETWKSSVGELHSELMVARLKAAREYMNQGYSMEESIDILKQFEKEGNDELFQFYLDEASGNLDKHFKESTDYDTKKMLVQILPAGAAIFGFSMLNNDNSNLDKQKYGGSIKDYKIEYLTDQEIKDLESQGFKVVVED